MFVERVVVKIQLCSWCVSTRHIHHIVFSQQTHYSLALQSSRIFSASSFSDKPNSFISFAAMMAARRFLSASGRFFACSFASRHSCISCAKWSNSSSSFDLATLHSTPLLYAAAESTSTSTPPPPSRASPPPPSPSQWGPVPRPGSASSAGDKPTQNVLWFFQSLT